MSSNNSRAPTGNSGTGGTMGSKIASVATGGNIGIALFGIVSLGMFIGAFVNMSNFVGSKDDWNVIKPQITKILDSNINWYCDTDYCVTLILYSGFRKDNLLYLSTHMCIIGSII